MVDGAWREQIEKQVAEHEIVLSDLGKADNNSFILLKLFLDFFLILKNKIIGSKQKTA